MGGPTVGQLDRARAGIAVERLLALADERYRSADVGIRALPLRFAIGIRTARLVYAAIGGVIARRRFDVHAGRAIVPRWRKLWLAARAVVGQVARRLLP
jgi:15-cis-phytoene synthase